MAKIDLTSFIPVLNFVDTLYRYNKHLTIGQFLNIDMNELAKNVPENEKGIFFDLAMKLDQLIQHKIIKREDRLIKDGEVWVLMES